MSTRELSPAPVAVLDTYGWPRFGSYRGELPRVSLASLGRGPVFRFAHHKRWMYVMIVSEELLLVVSVAHLGYLANSFVYALDVKERRMLMDSSSIAPPHAASVGDTAGEGCAVVYRSGEASVSIDRGEGSSEHGVRASMKGVEVSARLKSEGAPPGIAVIAPLSEGLLDATEKRGLLEVSGEAVIEGRRFSLDGALAGYDYTNGLLPRRSTWRWAFAMGRAKGGQRVALNLVEGFTGELECAVWVDGELYPVGEGRFEFDRERPLAPWRVRTADERVDLSFEPMGMHAEVRDYKLVASRFFQPAGRYSGRIRAPGGQELELDGVLGVTEDQDMLW